MIAVIDYGMGNLGSVAHALKALGGDFRIAASPREMQGARGILLPGVGNFGDGMEHLTGRGFAEAVRKHAADGGAIFGICLGMQMLFDTSEEAPGVAGLGILPGRVRRFPAGKAKVPHMGWNNVRIAGKNEMLKGFPDGAFVYFVHSYYVETANPDDTLLECGYMLPFAAAAGRGNIFATQFHPEKSQSAGLKLLENFLEKDRI